MREIKKIAVLLFVRNAYEELKHKALIKGESSKNVLLFKYLNKRIVNTVKDTDYNYFIIDSSQQHGRTFAERFKNAFKSIFQAGYDAVISLGNDTPQVNSKTLHDVVDHFEHNDVVVGKTNLGGAYTIGLTKYAFSKCSFEAVDWRTSHVVESIEERAIFQGSSFVQLDEVYTELSTHNDLNLFLQQLLTKHIRLEDDTFFLSLISKPNHFDNYPQLQMDIILHGVTEIRGSPSFI
ncbi:DUF2064 domain-containing protein [Brumimicrobium aurantiacum]|uniref:DUF2064 domain-containing protein n=1 Tax=Brumimicrobium aurantiacum TaxID=1737063 RepID=UPI0014021C18|nr:DUF2064 domain-containing protein [Brumimicrobium aurantiacum]